MTALYRNLARPFLFSQDAELAHERALRGLSLMSRSRWLAGLARRLFGAPPLPVECWGLRFPNPLGLAAGMDKFACALPAWAAVGFGWSELGGVTRHAQPGNPLPRVFRIVRDQAIINRMGFNNPGAAAMAAALAEWRGRGLWPAHPVGMNLGKSKITPLDEAAEDYASSLRLLWNSVDLFVVNVSSPNTPQLRQLQDKAALSEILAALQEVNSEEAKKAGARPKPILVKVAPDLSFEALDDIIELVPRHAVAGLVATNTTIARPAAGDSGRDKRYAEAGGLSGRPLRARSLDVVRHLHRGTGGSLPIVGVGGIFSADDAWEFLQAGATLLQTYTGFVYEGPGFAREVVRGLVRKLKAEGGGGNA